MDWRCHSGSVNDISPYLLFETIGDSEDINVDFVAEGGQYYGDDDVGSCNSETCYARFVDIGSISVDDYCQDYYKESHEDVDVAYENRSIYKKTTSLSSLSSTSSVCLDDQESRIVHKKTSGTAVQDEYEDIDDENTKLMNEMEKKKLFWDSCLGY